METDPHLNFIFKWSLHFSTFAVKLFDSGIKLFQATVAIAAL